MLITLIGAFANYFLIINSNTTASATWKRNHPEIKQDYYYVADYIGMGDTLVDAYFSMYLLALGEFEFEGFKHGPNRSDAWLFFLFATFSVLIVFMNIIIAIMGNTFSKVEARKKESAIVE